MAIQQLSSFPWASFRVARTDRVHAKMYSCISSEEGALALVGSHNLTAAAVQRNIEAGFFLQTLHRSSLNCLIESIHSQSFSLFLESSIYYDSTTRL
ncbi:restriction endonuclease PLD domain-containing protein [Photobacterium profundum]|uniref:restriction endonuclease PLD domain-containing protein n=1 Tax=Photobacterium profundum TaxID=74109 RepID=UPI003D0EC5F1